MSKAPTAHRHIVVRRVYNQLCEWEDFGYSDLPYSYMEIFHMLFPENKFGQSIPSFMRISCEAWQDTYNKKISELLPNLNSTKPFTEQD